MNHSTESHSAPVEALEARFGACLAAGLSERTAQVPHDISERLRVGRQQALTVARQRQVATQAASSTGVVAMAGRAGVLGHGRGPFWLRLASVLPLALLIGGMLLIQEWTAHEQVMAAAEIDAVLLADDLPPAAWADPGFREYLKAPPP